MSKKDNVLREVVLDMQRLWRRRGGRIPATVSDTIDALFTDDMKPIIIERQPLDSGWFFVIHLPPRICFADFKSKERYFADSTGGAVQISKQGKAVYLSVMTDELQGFYPYEWDPFPHDKMCLPFPAGYSAAGFLVRDLADIVNLLVAGHPGSGKSAFLHMLICSLLTSRNVYICIIDRKRLEYGYLRKHALVVTSDPEAVALLRALNKERERRIAILEKNEVTRLQDVHGHEETMPFVVVVIDELAEIEDERAQEELNSLVRLGRASGVLCVAATQRPDSKTFDSWSNSKAMFPGTMCFHVRDEINSRVVLGNDRAALIPNIPGRAIFQYDIEIETQSMYLPAKQAKKLLAGAERSVFNVGESQKRLPPR